jgi:uncharacterized membrane-anchored protein YhcB (DUF1043 family)
MVYNEKDYAAYCAGLLSNYRATLWSVFALGILLGMLIGSLIVELTR